MKPDVLVKPIAKILLPKVKNVLIAQPHPEGLKSPYFDLASKYKLTIDFFPFIQLESIPSSTFRKSRINPVSFSAVIFTSKSAADHFFRICEELRIKMPESTKYYCMSESIALYLQKYILYRKRKVFFGDGTVKSFFAAIEKHHTGENYLLPCSDNGSPEISNYLKSKDLLHSEAMVYNAVIKDVKKEVKINDYDMIVFFSPTGVHSLFHNFPRFKQGNIRLGAFGPATARAVIDSGLRLDLSAPAPNSPSMTMAIEQYLRGNNK
jgi:uroporphyrinogen-III synthase